jgi:predicted NBD/HSP70 family sugar kinase
MQSAHLREHNLTLVMRALQAATEPLSRAGLAQATGLTKPTVSKLVEELLGARLVREDAPVSSGTGRPRVPVVPATGTVLGIGLEVTADHVSCLGLDLAGTVLSRHVEQLDVAASAVERTEDVCVQLVRRAQEEAAGLPVAGICAALPGRISADGSGVLSAPNLGWSDVPFMRDLQQHPDVGGVPVRGQNDNRLSVLTELDRRPGQSFVYLRGSTGVGGAIVLDGRILEGEHGWAGEIGHTVVQPGGALCRCGRRGCLEAYVSHHALRERAGLGEDVLIDDLVDALAASSDRTEVIGTIGRALGIAVANALNVLDLSTVVLSGYLAPIADELGPVVRETVDEHALAIEAGPVEVTRADGVSEPALRGAARAALEPLIASPGAWIARTA